MWFYLSLILILTACLLLHLAQRLYQHMFGAPKRYDTVSPARQQTRHYQAARKGMDLMDTLPMEDVYLTSRDGLNLHACYFPPENGSGKVVLGIHGYHSYAKLEYGPFIEFYRGLGYGMLLPDDRAHRPSEGNYIGFAVKDSLDCVDWAKYLVQRLGRDCEILLHGVSMGAATVMTASGDPELPDQVKGIVADCGFTTLWEELHTKFWDSTQMPKFPFVWLLERINVHRQGFDFRHHTPLEQVKKAAVPMLFVHGTADQTVPVEMAQRLYQACSAKKELLLVEHADHAESIVYAPQEYHGAIRRLFGI